MRTAPISTRSRESVAWVTSSPSSLSSPSSSAWDLTELLPKKARMRAWRAVFVLGWEDMLELHSWVFGQAGGDHQPGHHGLLCVHAVFGFVEHYRLRAVDHLGVDFVAAVGRQAMQHDRVVLGQLHRFGGHRVVGEQL